MDFSFSIINTGTTAIRVDYRHNDKVYDAHVPDEDGMQATFDSEEIQPAATVHCCNVNVLSIVALGV
jgi:hypothetical protein